MINKKIDWYCLALGMISVLLCPTLLAETPEQQGQTIMQEADRRQSGFVDNQADLKMTIRRGDRVSSTREMQVSVLEGNQERGDMSLMVVQAPLDQRGVALLTHKHPNRDDEQWLYLPADKRVKQIASNKKTGTFMGSEFSYEDIAGQSLEEYSYKLIAEDSVVNQAVWVVENTPLAANSGYTKVLTYIDKEHYRALKTEFFDRKSSLLKTLTPSDFKLYEQKFWRPGVLEMVNHQTRRSTRLEHHNIKFNIGLTENDFNRNSLRRAR